MPSPCSAVCGFRGSLIVALLCATAACAQDWEVDWDRVGEVAQQIGVDVKDLDLKALEIIDVDAWKDYWSAIETALQGDSFEDLARWRPYAEQAIDYLDRHPGAESYASWLRQRLDYFVVAEEKLKAEPETHYTPAPAGPPKKPTWKPPPPAPRRPPAESAAVRKAERKAASEKAWHDRLAQRPAPRRASELVPRIKAVFEAEGLPSALVWLAEVESTMDPSARSPVGAVGLFQLMPATAKHLGLSTFPFDQRKDPEKNARAAARYLRQLYGRFQQWSLALAAYNAGEGNLSKAIKRTGSRDFDTLAPDLPVETRLYVPKIKALLQLREGVALDQLPAPKATSQPVK